MSENNERRSTSPLIPLPPLRPAERGRFKRLIEDDGAVAAEEDTFLQHEPETAGQDELLDVAAGLGHLASGMGMVDGEDVLANDGAVIEFFGNEMGGGADDFHAPGKGLLIRFGADEGRQEGMVDVDHAIDVALHESAAEHAHVFREHDVIRSIAVEDGGESCLVFRAGFSHVADLLERDSKLTNDGFEAVIIAEHGEHFGAEFAIGMAHKQFRQAMMLFGGEDNDGASSRFRQAHPSCGREDLLEFGQERAGLGRAGKGSTHEEPRGGFIHELVIANDVEAMAEQDSGDPMDEAGFVRTFDQKKVSVYFHR